MNTQTTNKILLPYHWAGKLTPPPEQLPESDSILMYRYWVMELAGRQTRAFAGWRNGEPVLREKWREGFTMKSFTNPEKARAVAEELNRRIPNANFKAYYAGYASR